ncbi:MAG: acyl--CoA ligase, partial [Candidatus Methanofastidiosa archaeon]|nr:acyl--CoA ligase [Candidatus Methanofastidiosa archaeon]
MIINGKTFWNKEELFDLVLVPFNNYEVCAYKESQNLLFDILHSAATKEPGRIALEYNNISYTYKELEEKVIEIIQFLESTKQVKYKEVIAILMNNRPEFVTSIFSITYLGAIACPLNARLNPNEIIPILKDCKTKILITDDLWFKKIQPLIKETNIQHVINVDHLLFNFLKENDRHKIKNEILTKIKNNIYPDDPAIILYTSGTTNKPKGVTITHFNIFNSVITYSRILKIGQNDSTVIAVPLSYVTGLIAQLLLFFYCKGKVYLMKEFHSEDLLCIFHKKQITFFHATAAFFNIMLNTKNRNDYNLTSLKMVLCGGGPSPKKMISSLREWLPWLDFRTVYGLTETSSPATILPKYKIENNFYTCGKPIPVIDLKIVNESNRDLEYNEIGEVLLRGGVVVPNYWNNFEETRNVFHNGWFRTGDIGKIDENGFLYILD